MAPFAACTSPAGYTGLSAASTRSRCARSTGRRRRSDRRLSARSPWWPPTAPGERAGAGRRVGPAARDRSDARGGRCARQLAVRHRSPGAAGHRPAAPGTGLAHGTATLRASCPSGELSCRVRLRLRLGRAYVATRTLSLAGGTTRSFRLRLGRGARLRLARKGSLRVTAVTTSRDAAGNQVTARMAVRLLAPRRR